MKLPLIARFCLVVCLAVALSACGRGALKSKEFAYVSSAQGILRDRLAPVYNKVGALNNGERVEVLETKKRFVRVRTTRGEEGWIEQRYLVGTDVFAAVEKLAKENAGAAAQSKGITRASLNMHVAPDRDADHLYLLKDADRVDILKRATAEKPQTKVVIKGKETPQTLEDWWLVRDSRGRAGWVLARMVDIDAPMDVAQYAEGQRIVTCRVLNEVQDGDKKVPQYVVLLTEDKDGLLFDYNQARIFTWNLKRHRYETAYRERKLAGFFPVSVGRESFNKEGELPTFTLRVQREDGQFADRKYKLNGPIVRRVISPDEEAKIDAEKATKKRPGS